MGTVPGVLGGGVYEVVSRVGFVVAGLGEKEKRKKGRGGLWELNEISGMSNMIRVNEKRLLTQAAGPSI